MNDRFLRLQKILAAARRSIQVNLLAVGVVFVIFVSLFLSLGDRDPADLLTGASVQTTAAALPAEQTGASQADVRLPTGTPLRPTDKPTASATATLIATHTEVARPTVARNTVARNTVARNTTFPTELPTATVTVTPTSTPTFTSTSTATDTPTFTSTATATASLSATPTVSATATNVYVPISVFPSDIEIGAPDNVAGRVNLFPARLRAGPSTQDDVFARLGEGIRVTLGGITANGAWALLKVTDPRTELDGKEGWMAIELIEVDGDLTTLHRYTDEGIRIRPFGSRPPGIQIRQTSTPVAATAASTPTATVTDMPTATAITTQVAPLPALHDLPTESSAVVLHPAQVAPPQAGEFVATVLGDVVPANPMEPIFVRTDNGEVLLLNIEPLEEQVSMWSGIFGASRGEWLPARSDFLWPGARVYVAGQQAKSCVARHCRARPGANQVTVSSVRVIAPPSFQRVTRTDVPIFGAAWQSGQAVALLGKRGESGVFLLQQDGTVAAIREAGQTVLAVRSGANGFVIPNANAPADRNGFLYVRGDGKGLAIQTHPFQSVRGIAADERGDLWWIEMSQVGLAQWRLWHYDSRAEQIVLRVQASTSLLGGRANRAIEPSLIAVASGAGDVRSFIIDTADIDAGRQFTGLYRIDLDINGELESSRLARADIYRGPFQLSPDDSRLAHLAFDPQHPSLTAGFVRPSNQLWVQDLPANGSGARGRLRAQTETRFEFFAPKVAWRDDDRLVLARSRFSPQGVFSLDIFGITEVDLRQTVPNLSSYLYPPGTVIGDYAACADGSVLLTVRSGNGVALHSGAQNNNPRLEEWSGAGQPQMIGQLPEHFDRIFLCWQRYAGNVRIRQR